MISLIILIAPLFFMGRFFGELAFEHNRNRWGFRLLAIGVYLVTYFIVSFVVGFIGLSTIEVNADDSYAQVQQKIDGVGWIALITAITLASLAALILFRIVKSSWSKNPKSAGNGDLLDR